ncbi:MAG TPA: hypothetical protein VGL56_13650 [Fimbriimonadaceae bacterium]|jgi:hypothetical protein
MVKGLFAKGAILWAALVLAGCGTATSPIPTAVASTPLQALPLTPEQRAGSVSFQMNTAVDALSQATTKSESLRTSLGAKAPKDLDKLDSLLYSAGETIGDYPNNPPTGKKGPDLKAWMDKASSAATTSLEQLQQAESLATGLDKDDSLAGSIRVSEDALRGAIQSSSSVN